jgi:hypothetical protein
MSRRGLRKTGRRAVRNLRRGRIQRSLAAATAASALPLGLEIWFEHFRGSFGDKWMWTPVVLSPALAAAGAAGVRSEWAATTVLPAVSALYCLDGVIGIYTHVQGVRNRLVTGWGDRRGVTEEFEKRWPYLGGEGARLLLDHGVAGVGIDALGIGGWGGPEVGEPSHAALLGPAR